MRVLRNTFLSKRAEIHGRMCNIDLLLTRFHEGVYSRLDARCFLKAKRGTKAELLRLIFKTLYKAGEEVFLSAVTGALSVPVCGFEFDIATNSIRINFYSDTSFYVGGKIKHVTKRDRDSYVILNTYSDEKNYVGLSEKHLKNLGISERLLSEAYMSHECLGICIDVAYTTQPYYVNTALLSGLEGMHLAYKGYDTALFDNHELELVRMQTLPKTFRLDYKYGTPRDEVVIMYVLEKISFILGELSEQYPREIDYLSRVGLWVTISPMGATPKNNIFYPTFMRMDVYYKGVNDSDLVNNTVVIGNETYIEGTLKSTLTEIMPYLAHYVSLDDVVEFDKVVESEN